LHHCASLKKSSLGSAKGRRMIPLSRLMYETERDVYGSFSH
jgi:hypothetical protein